MEINQAIEEWLELCPCDDFIAKDQQAFGGKFNRSKIIILNFNHDDYTEPTDQEMMANFGTKWHDGL
tara:strand:- start:1069 stop:1269 length:201 start_codon:yes stop_codon:yes gene_type:complete